MKMNNSPILAALLVTLSACGGNSDSEPTSAQQPGLVISAPGNNPGSLLNDPVTATPIDVTEPDPVIPEPVQQPVQQPTNPIALVQDTPDPVEPTSADPAPTQPTLTEPPEPIEQEPQVTQEPEQQPVQQPEQQPTSPPEPVQDTPDPIEPVSADPAPTQPIPTEPEPTEPVEQADPVEVEPPVAQEPEVSTGGCVVPQAGSTVVSQTTPVKPSDNPSFYPSMGPQCVSPSNQFDGPGLAFGDFLLSNNAWNGRQSTWEWQQCIALTEASDGSILPSWSYDWGNEDDLQPGLFEWEVKTYPEIIFGHKSNQEISAPCSSTGLPAKVSDLPDYSIGYTYRAPLTDNRVGDLGDENNNPSTVTGGDRNVAIETFFHSSCDIIRGASSNMELELMVWLEAGNERLPSGEPPVAQFTSGNGQTYDVYTKSNNYVAYVAQNPVRSGTLNYSEFINDTIGNSTSYGVKTLQNDWCMANIIFGSEIWWGEGSVNVDFYQITRQY